MKLNDILDDVMHRNKNVSLKIPRKATKERDKAAIRFSVFVLHKTN